MLAWQAPTGLISSKASLAGTPICRGGPLYGGDDGGIVARCACQTTTAELTGLSLSSGTLRPTFAASGSYRQARPQPIAALPRVKPFGVLEGRSLGASAALRPAPFTNWSVTFHHA